MYEHLAATNPRIVCCSLSGFGMTGPRAKEGGYDYIMQGLAGWMSLTGEPDGPPAKSGLSLVDLSGGYVAAIAILAGLWRAQRDGVGCDCDISLFETALAELMYVGTWAASRGYEPPRRASSAHPSIVPFQNFRTADGWVVVACAKQKFWVALCDVLGRPDLAEDERFADFAGRDANRDDLLAILDAAFAERGTDAWLEALAAAGVPSGRVNTVAEALEDEQTRARGAVVAFEHPRLGPVREVATPLRVGDEPPLARGPPRRAHRRGPARPLRLRRRAPGRPAPRGRLRARRRGVGEVARVTESAVRRHWRRGGRAGGRRELRSSRRAIVPEGNKLPDGREVCPRGE